MNTLSPVEQSKWAYLKASGLHDNIESFADYQAEVAIGMGYAHMNICRQEGYPMGPNIVKQSHLITYGEAEVNAGKYRTQDAAIGGLQSTPASRIPEEMAMLEAQTAFLFDHAKTPLQKLEATAFAHAKLMRIRPFKDGNGEIGKMFLVAHLREGFEVPMNYIGDELSERKESHVKALNESYTKNDLTPLMEFMAETVEVAEPAIGKVPVPDRNPTPFGLDPSAEVSFSNSSPMTEDLLRSRNLEWFNQLPTRSNDSDFRVPAGTLPPIRDEIGRPVLMDGPAFLKKLPQAVECDIE